MMWKDPRKELPPSDKPYRCLAEIYVDKGCTSWKGIVDVFFDSTRGWMRCENKEQVEICKYVYMQEFEDVMIE